MDLSIIIPALNERTKIQLDLEAAWKFLQAFGLAGEIIVVADGSTDDTFEIATACAQRIPVLRVLPYTTARGKGAAIKRGVEAANGDIIMFADAGLCVPYEDAVLGIELLRSGSYELAHGSRAERKTVVVKSQPLWRRMGSRAFSFLVHAAMGIPREIGDTQCGFKLYQRKPAQRLYGRLTTSGYMFDVELILRALREGYRIGHFPVHWSNDEDSRYDPVKGTVQILRALARLRMTLAFEGKHRLGDGDAERERGAAVRFEPADTITDDVKP